AEADGSCCGAAVGRGVWKVRASTHDGRMGCAVARLGSGDAAREAVVILDGPHVLEGGVEHVDPATGGGGGPFHGRVLLEPAARAGPGPDGDASTTTDAQGRFRFDAVPAGRYRLRAYHPQRDTILETVVDVPSAAPVRLR